MKDKKLLKTVAQFSKGILGKKDNKDMCFAICAPLSTYLNMLGVRNELTQFELHKGGDIYCHWVLVLEDGRIIDPTASQFNDWVSSPMPDVYIGEKPHYYNIITN